MKTHIVCDECGKSFTPGNDKNGIPNGVGFQLTDGTVLNVCRDCIEMIGEMEEPEASKLIKDLKLKAK